MKKSLSSLKPVAKLIAILFIAIFTACQDDPKAVEPEPEPEPEPEVPVEPADPTVELSLSAPERTTVTRRQSTEVKFAFTVTGEAKVEWTCTSTNPDVLTVEAADSTTVSITGVAAGQAAVKIEATAGEAKAEAEIAVVVEPGTYKILAIGNSFSQDAVEQYLYDLAKAAGIDVVIGNLYIGGCTLDKHLSNLQSDAAAYEYRKVVGGKKENKTNTRCSVALADEPWDYISLQQASGQSGLYQTYSGLPEIINYVSTAAPQATLMWHQTWAYAAGSNHESFPNYNKDQMTMYKAIVDAARRAMNENSALKIMVPSGTAIQNARATYVGDIFNRDGYHLEVTYGRYTAACTWFEAIFGIDVTGNTYKPATVSDEMAAIARAAAHSAVQCPDAVTEIPEFAHPAVKEGDLTAAVYVDFGPNSISDAPWNNFTAFEPSTAPVWLKDADGNFVQPGISILGGFTGSYLGVSGETNHSAFTAAGIEFPISAWKDGLIVAGTKGTGNTPTARLAITSLNPAKQYSITLLAVRYNGSRDARISSYRLIGSSDYGEKQIKPGLKIGSGAGTYTNFDKVPFEEYAVTYTAVSPAADGTITIEVTGIDTGLAAEGLLNALVITPM